ncbi:hypothetical protein ACLOJK_030721 [Asimina triloba]
MASGPRTPAVALARAMHHLTPRTRTEQEYLPVDALINRPPQSLLFNSWRSVEKLQTNFAMAVTRDYAFVCGPYEDIDHQTAWLVFHWLWLYI